MIYKMNSKFNKNEMMQEGTLTSFALHDLYRSNCHAFNT